jgi:hypothetical protein
LVVLDCQRKACRLSLSFITGILPKFFHKIADIDISDHVIQFNKMAVIFVSRVVA